jgi:hypothetical protein
MTPSTDTRVSAGFTPGPWNDDGPIIYTGINQRTGKIAEVSLAYKDSETYRANIALIAAAPELYEALACLLSRFCELNSECGNDSDKQSEVIIARAALTKARAAS